MKSSQMMFYKRPTGAKLCPVCGNELGNKPIYSVQGYLVCPDCKRDYDEFMQFIYEKQQYEQRA